MGSTPASLNFNGNICAAIKQYEKIVSKKSKAKKYISYFQNFCNTYSSAQRLEKLYNSAIDDERIVALDIATRPDCFCDEIYSLLEKINKQKPVFVELGLQTIHPKTAEYIRRGYTLETFDNAIFELKKRGIRVIVHQIIGLPGETDEMIFKTAEYIGKSGADGIKFHLLYVVKGTDLEKDFNNGFFKTLSLQKYISLLEGCLENIPANVAVHRLTGDGAKKDLISPLWSADKKHVLNEINRRLKIDGIIQGSKVAK